MGHFWFTTNQIYSGVYEYIQYTYSQSITLGNREKPMAWIPYKPPGPARKGRADFSWQKNLPGGVGIFWILIRNSLCYVGPTLLVSTQKISLSKWMWKEFNNLI